MKTSIMPTYNRLPISFVKGEGAWLIDDKDNKYLDCISGIAVCVIGHANKNVARAIAKQSQELIHTSNLYKIPHQETLATRLCELSGMDNVFFSNSGAEANEAAIKIARKFGHENNINEPNIIVAENSFHGRTLATLSATGNRKIQAGFEPLVTGFIRVPYANVEAIQKVCEANKNIAAVLLEPVQGEGGVNIPNANYLREVKKVCEENNVLLMLDEVQTGLGRTGKMFAFEHSNIQPDVITLAKSLGNGVPIGACLAGGKAAKILGAGNHGSTFGGNPLACRAALATLDEIESEKLVVVAKTQGRFLQKAFAKKLQNIKGVKKIKGLGMMLGIELEQDCTELVTKALEHRLLINVTAGNVIRLLPALNMSEDEQSLMVDKLSALIIEHLGGT